MSALTDILAWSQQRPLWQQDALRRLVEKGELAGADLTELHSMIKGEHNLLNTGEQAPNPCPLSDAHLPTNSGAGQRVAITGIKNVQNVNALVPGAEISFDPNGLTVVYGDNGAGKSGYVRILKKVCRARAADMPILPNVFREPPDQPATAMISFEAGASSHELDWEDGQSVPSPLSLVNVFDSSSAAVYVSAENDVYYVPFGLDLLEKLASACDQFRDMLEREQSADIGTLAPMPEHLSDTAAAKWLDSLTISTQARDIHQATAFNARHKAVHQKLVAILNTQDPQARATEIDAKIIRYTALKDHATALGAVINEDELTRLKEVHSEARAAWQALELARAQAFNDVPLQVGSDAWERMWKAAEEFHAEGHEGALPDATHCPLCQQPLQDDGKTRFRRFAEYFLQRAQSEEAAKRKDLSELVKRFSTLDVATSDYGRIIDEIRSDDKSEFADHATAYLDYCCNIKAVAATVTPENNLDPVLPVPNVQLESLSEIIVALERQASSLRAAADPVRRAKLAGIAAKLEAKQWLSGRRDEILAEVERIARHARRADAIHATLTTGITQTATQLTKTYVTEELRRSFTEELGAITLSAPPVDLASRPGEKGVSYYSLMLSGQVHGAVKPPEVLSEGEMRAISLAAFLSELSTEESGSCIVLDDPVSSFDIKTRERFAPRLVDMSSERQIVVFTHDPFFLVCLHSAAENARSPFACFSLERLSQGAGVAQKDIPLPAMSVNKMIRQLKNRCQTALSLERQNPNVYSGYVRSICTDLRAVLEHIVEDVLLSGIVKRFRRAIHMAELPKLAHIKQEDVMFLDKLMTDYSKLEHSQTPGSIVPLPSLQEIQQDLANLQGWVKDFRNPPKNSPA